MLLFETHLPTRFYLPREDVRLDLLEVGEFTSHCPYKGTAREYWDLPEGADHAAVPGVAWSYTEPFPAVGAVAGRVAFYDELVDVEVDGEPRVRPVTIFSDRRHRPTSA